MNSPGKLTDSNASKLAIEWSEELARLHCLQALFPDLTGADGFLLNQLKASIEASLQASGFASASYAEFAAMAASLRSDRDGPVPLSCGFICMDFTGRTWDPLFARDELVRALKKKAGSDHVFIVVKGLPGALFPKARYLTERRNRALKKAMATIDALANQWSTPSTTLQLLYL
jgi:hypothetical protein